MAISIPASLVEFLLIGPSDDRRQLQDSPILGDVWIAFGQAPDKRHSLLISPYKTQDSGQVAAAIAREIRGDDAEIAYLQGLVIADLTFRDVLSVIVPKTSWWIGRWTRRSSAAQATSKQGTAEPAGYVHEIQQRYFTTVGTERLAGTLGEIVKAATDWHGQKAERRTLELLPIDRFTALAGLILWAGKKRIARYPSSADGRIGAILKELRKPAEIERIVKLLRDIARAMLRDDFWTKVKEGGKLPLVYSVSCNRKAMPAIARSVPAVKADAATTLFNVDCSGVAWAVLDSGIDGAHPAFLKSDRSGSRVVKTYDFRNFRKIVNLGNTKPSRLKKSVKELMADQDSLRNPPEEPEKDLQQLAQDAERGGRIHWELVERFVELKSGTKPATNHGTHVAGIIGANGKAAKKRAEEKATNVGMDFDSGMCPDVQLYDFRVLGDTLQDTEFAIIAAMQFIRHLNDRDAFLSIHGANLSLSIPHDVRNYACGRTPICEECERLINGGVVVVVAAGNHGYKSFETKDGAFETYAAFSITDPGNADGVITVGSTHRYWPHTYGVSFFSSRGPTGDGRLKPDLVAPGERIRAPFPGESEFGGAWGELDGTSMAAPHVSGAAAMLLARYAELVGQPRRVKQILCDSATDLGRERSFQGHGMLDVLRAFQSI